METKELYNLLLTKINNKTPDGILTSLICTKIKKLPLIYAEVLLGLINRHYELNHSKKKLEESDYIINQFKKDGTLILPYKGKTYTNGKVPQFSGDKLPSKLENIIVEYINFIEDKT
jgi:hypothetical protein